MKKLSDMTPYEKNLYALRGNLREARYWRGRGDQKKADWYMSLAEKERIAATRSQP